MPAHKQRDCCEDLRSRSLTSDKCVASIKEREEKQKQNQQEKERKGLEREPKKKEKEEEEKRRKLLLQKGRL